MRIQWFGQSAFSLIGTDTTVFIDPFSNMHALVSRGMQWNYPPITGVSADLLLVTHEHADHNAVEAIGGTPQTIRSTAGTFDSNVGTVTAIASEHDPEAGTRLGPNSIICLTLDGVRICHFGDFGQTALRPEQRQAIGAVDLLFLPVGGMSTIDGDAAAQIVRALRPKIVIPMHYRTPAISFLEPADRFLDAMHAAQIVRLSDATLDTTTLPTGDGPIIAVPAPPLAS